MARLSCLASAFSSVIDSIFGAPVRVGAGAAAPAKETGAWRRERAIAALLKSIALAPMRLKLEGALRKLINLLGPQVDETAAQTRLQRGIEGEPDWAVSADTSVLLVWRRNEHLAMQANATAIEWTDRHAACRAPCARRRTS